MIASAVRTMIRFRAVLIAVAIGKSMCGFAPAWFPVGRTPTVRPPPRLAPFGGLHDAVQPAADQDRIGPRDEESHLLGEGESVGRRGAAASDYTDDQLPNHEGISVQARDRIKPLPLSIDF